MKFHTKHKEKSKTTEGKKNHFDTLQWNVCHEFIIFSNEQKERETTQNSKIKKPHQNICCVFLFVTKSILSHFAYVLMDKLKFFYEL